MSFYWYLHPLTRSIRQEGHTKVGKKDKGGDMRTKRVNVFEEQRKWMMWHHSAGATMKHDPQTGNVTEAVYESPIAKWSRYMHPDGTVEVLDMDYYSSLTSQTDITAAIRELGENFLL